MNTPDEASSVLHDAEGRIRKILATQAAKGNYPRVLTLTTIAQKLVAMAAALDKPAGDIASDSVSHPAPRAVAAAKLNGDYPRFHRRAEDLVKIGWSKRERKEYQHRMPHGTLTTVAAGLAVAGVGGKRFSVEALDDIKDAQGQVVPGYQTYLCLAFLRFAGLVRQDGRSNYSLEKDVDIIAAAEDAWTQLPEL